MEEWRDVTYGEPDITALRVNLFLDSKGDDDANHNADKSQTSHTQSEAMNFGKGDREGEEQKVQQMVHK